MDPELKHIDTAAIARDAAASARGKARPWRIATVGLAALLLALVAWIVVGALDQKDTALAQRDTAQGETVGLAQRVLQACRDEVSDPDTNALRDAGLCDRAKAAKDKVEDKTPKPDAQTLYIPGPQGPRGFPGLGGDDGTDGSDGSDGNDSTTPGPSGADSTVPGPQGPAGATGAPGKDGTDGKDGQRGDDGVSVTDVGCTGGLSPVTFTFTYSDGRTQSVTCGQLEPVEPTPSE